MRRAEGFIALAICMVAIATRATGEATSELGNCTCPSNSSATPSCLHPGNECAAAIQAFQWSVIATNSLCHVFDDDDDNPTIPTECQPLCSQVDRPIPVSALDQLVFFDDRSAYVGDWADFQGAIGLSSQSSEASTLGAWSYTLNSLSNVFADLKPSFTNGTINTQELFTHWQKQWAVRAALLIERGEDATKNTRARMNALLQATQALQHAQWPMASLNSSIELNNDSYSTLVGALALAKKINPTFTYQQVAIPYVSDDGQKTYLPGLFATSAPNTKLPLLVFTSGLDAPYPQIVLQFLSTVLANGYAFLTYEGPGQGQVIRNSPYLQYTPKWERVLEAVLDFSEANLNAHYNTSHIISYGISFGGWLNAKACTQLSHRLAGCVLDPPAMSLLVPVGGPLLEYASIPFRNADPSLIPNGYAPFVQNVTKMLDSILNCEEGKELIEGWIDLGYTVLPYDPDLLYFAWKFGANYQTLPNYFEVTNNLTALWEYNAEGMARLREFQLFPSQVANISCPVFCAAGAEDALEGTTTSMEFFRHVTPGPNNKFAYYTSFSGAGLHCQIGESAMFLYDTFAWMSKFGVDGVPTSSPIM